MKNKSLKLLWQGKGIPNIHISGTQTAESLEGRVENNDDFKEKSLAFYSHLVGQWFENRMEETRFIINISAGAIGLLVTLLTFIDKKPIGAWLLVLYIVALIGFLLALFISGISFRLNTVYLKKLKESLEDDSESPKSIAWLDWIAWSTFFIALLATVLFFILYLLIINK